MIRRCRELPLDPPDDDDDGDGEQTHDVDVDPPDPPDEDPDAGDRAAADYWDRVIMREPRW